MALNTKTLTDSLKNLFDKNNTTTSSYDLSANLSTRVQQVIKGDVEKQAIINILYPSIIIDIESMEIVNSQIGNNARRYHDITFSISPVIQYGIGSNTGIASTNTKNEIYYLTDNVLNIIRNHITLSSTVSHTDDMFVTYETIGDDKFYNEVSKIELKCRKLSD